LKPGPQSELSADCSAQFLFGPQIRDLEADMNVTKIGPDTLDRFLQLLDPDKANPAIQDYRKYLPLITIDEVAVFNEVLTKDDIGDIMNKGIKISLAVSPTGKLATSWGGLKTQY